MDWNARVVFPEPRSPKRRAISPALMPPPMTESMAMQPVLRLLILISCPPIVTLDYSLDSAVIGLRHIGIIADNIKDAYSVIRELKRLGLPFTMVDPAGPMPAQVQAAISCGEWRGAGFERVVDYRGDARRSVLEALSLAAGRRAFREVVVGVDPGDCVGVATIADGELIEAYAVPAAEAVCEVGRIASAYPSDRMVFRVGSGRGRSFCVDSMPNGYGFSVEYVEEWSGGRRLPRAFWRKGLRKDAKSAVWIALGGPTICSARRAGGRVTDRSP